MRKLELEFEIREFVYLRTDPEQNERLITGYIVRETTILYLTSFQDSETPHYGYELSREKNVLLGIAHN